MKVTFLLFLLAALAMLNVFKTAVEAAPQSLFYAAEPDEQKVDSSPAGAKDGDPSEEATGGPDKNGHGQGQGKGHGKGKGKEHSHGKRKGKGDEMGKGKGKGKGKGQQAE